MAKIRFGVQNYIDEREIEVDDSLMDEPISCALVRLFPKLEETVGSLRERIKLREAQAVYDSWRECLSTQYPVIGMHCAIKGKNTTFADLNQPLRAYEPLLRYSVVKIVYSHLSG